MKNVPILRAYFNQKFNLQAIQDVDEFGEIWHFVTCSPMDPLQWMGAVRMRIQTADKKTSDFFLGVNWWTGVVWITCGLLWCVYQQFGLSFWRHPFTAEDPLVSKSCNDTFLQICSHKETNSSTSWMAWTWVLCRQIFIFGCIIPLRLVECQIIFLWNKR